MNIVCIGAHPDDPEFYAGGSMVLWAQAGHAVTAVSMTNGDAGHYALAPDALAAIRREESLEAARRGGYQTLVLDTHDGELTPTLEARKDLVCLLRRLDADIVLSHRPWDYHPDHRYTGVLVQDAAFMVTVPHFCPETPALRKNPLFFGMTDAFTRAMPFRPDMLVAVDAVMPTKWALLDAMKSQVYEWLPWLAGRLDAAPAPEAEFSLRRAWLEESLASMFTPIAEHYRAELQAWYGDSAADMIFVEAFEVCEYGRRPEPGELRRLCPTLPDPSERG